MTNYLPEDLPREPSTTAGSDPKDVPSDSRGWAVAAHLLPLVSIYIFGALIIWLIKRDEDEFVEEHAREALNFQLSVLIYGVVSVILVIVLIGILMLLVLAIFSLVMSIIAGVKAANGEEYRYPLTIRMIKSG